MSIGGSGVRAGHETNAADILVFPPTAEKAFGVATIMIRVECINIGIACSLQLWLFPPGLQCLAPMLPAGEQIASIGIRDSIYASDSAHVSVSASYG